MGKYWKFTSVLIIVFFLMSIKVSAQTLNCNTYLTNGSAGSEVKVLQTMLNKTIKCNLEVDGIFGAATNHCVTSFQSKYNLDVDGIVGPNTCSKLNILVSSIEKPSYIASNKALAIGNNVNIRKSATTSSKVVGKLDIGDVVTLVKQVGDWYKIKLSKNNYGYVYSPLVSRNVIVIDISDQNLTYYEKGKSKQQTPVVTGLQNSHDTPIGRYVLKTANMKQGVTLRGYNDDGSKYASYVDYWMPFITERGIGMHDATWRNTSEFNNSTYQYSGSHGCVNMQLNAAKQLYESITTDTAVVVKK